MEIKRDMYLNKLISKRNNGLIKVVTGIRRCGKSYLLFKLFKDYLMNKEGFLLVTMHWEHRVNHMVKWYNDIYRVQMPNITPLVCRHIYCSNMAKSGMNLKTLQYLMGHS